MEERGAGVGLSSTAEDSTTDGNADAAAAGGSLQEKGFVVTSVDAVMNWARTGSLWPIPSWEAMKFR